MVHGGPSRAGGGEEMGGVRWNVTLYNQDDEQVAEYELLTVNAYATPISPV